MPINAPAPIRHADEMETLLTVQQAITSRLDPDAVLQLIADGARRLTNTQLSLVFLLEGDYLRIAVLSGRHSPNIFVGYHVPAAQSVAGISIRTGQPIIVNDVYQDPRAYADAVRRLGVHSYMTVPLISAAQPIGVMAVADEQVGILGPDHERALAMLAAGAVISLENARLYREEQERRQVAEGLRDILAILNSNRPLEEILDYIVAQAGHLLGSAAVAIYRWQSEAGELSIQAARGLSANYKAAASLPINDPADLTRLPIAIFNVSTLATNGGGKLSPPWSTLVERLPARYRAVLIVPLVVKDEVYGDMLLYYTEPRAFAEDEIGLAVTFGDQAALAIENARLRTQVEQAAVTAERHRLARDLHDAVTQTLFSASLIAEVMPRLWERYPDDARRSLEELRQLTRGALAEMRALLLELRPAALTETPLSTLLRHLTDAMTGRTRIPIKLTIEGDNCLLPDVQIALYRIAQEALNNVAKHAEASQSAVNLRCWSGGAELRISDNGRGFDPSQISPAHLGVGIMRERAKSIGAALAIDSQPGQGTKIKVEVQP